MSTFAQLKAEAAQQAPAKGGTPSPVTTWFVDTFGDAPKVGTEAVAPSTVVDHVNALVDAWEAKAGNGKADRARVVKAFTDAVQAANRGNATGTTHVVVVTEGAKVRAKGLGVAVTKGKAKAAPKAATKAKPASRKGK